MNFFTHYKIVFIICAVSVYFICGASAYIMPVCSENGGVCNDKSEDSSNDITLKITNMSELFSFVTKSVEITKRWIYSQIFTICYIFSKEPDVPPRPTTYIDSVWSFFGFREEPPKQSDMEYSSCNPSVFGIILMFYFGYVFMATKCFVSRKPLQFYPEPKFLPFLADNKGEEEDEDIESEDESSIHGYDEKELECPNHKCLPICAPEKYH